MNIYDVITEKVSENKLFAITTIVQHKGSTPRSSGSKMVVDTSRNIWGTVGGGTVEALVIDDAVKAMENGKSELRHYGLREVEKAGIGMLCGGEVDVFIEVILPQPALVVLGAGHLGQPLASIGKILGFKVIVIDDRPEFANTTRFPEVDEIILKPYHVGIQDIALDRFHYVTIVSRNEDEEILEQILDKNPAYIGLLASRRKAAVLRKNLEAKGYQSLHFDKVHMPTGLNIGAESPEEIALSILGEIINIKNGGTSKSMREKGQKNV